MKTTSRLTAALLASVLSTQADPAPNPFAASPESKPPQGPAGDSFVTVVEHIIVPAKQLDDWLASHPIKDDATDLRAAAQKWVTEKSASLDHTSISVGTHGREFTSEHIWEQIYPTEYAPPKGEEWPFATAFATMNCGYETVGGSLLEGGSALLRARMSVCGMLPAKSYLSDRVKSTCLPDDVFMPQFRSIIISRQAPPPDSVDPFAEPEVNLSPDTHVRYAPGHIHLAGRFDQTQPESAVSDPSRPTRLVFFRGNFMPSPEEPEVATPAKLLCSVKLYQVNHRKFSDWLQSTDINTLRESAWSKLQEWETAGDARALNAISGGSEAGASTNFENIVNVTYPTEYEPAFGAGTHPKQHGFSYPSAWEKRNTGMSFESHIFPDPKGAMLSFVIERVRERGQSVFRRVLRDDVWHPDITGPNFNTNRWKSEIRVATGKWLLVGSGSEMVTGAKADQESCLLVFLRMD